MAGSAAAGAAGPIRLILRRPIISDFQNFLLTARPNQFFNSRRFIPQ
jgi:hypothetical protein